LPVRVGHGRAEKGRETHPDWDLLIHASLDEAAP
jgi:hypothetical protein